MPNELNSNFFVFDLIFYKLIVNTKVRPTRYLIIITEDTSSND